MKYNGTVAPTHDEILDAVKAQMASKGLEFVDATVSAGVITMEFKGANGSRFVKYTPASAPSISTVTNSEDLEKALESGADKVVLNGDATLSDGIPADTAVEVTEGKTLTLTGNKTVSSPVTGKGTTEITGTIKAGSNIMTSEVVVGPEASVNGTIGDADSGNPSNLTFSKDVDEITSAWNVSGSITIDHDITVANGGKLNAPELVVEKGKELTFAKNSTLTTVHVTMKAGSILTAAVGDGVSYTFTKQVELWFVGADEDGDTLENPYVQISWAGGDTACQQSDETRKTIRNIINAMIALDEADG